MKGKGRALTIKRSKIRKMKMKSEFFKTPASAAIREFQLPVRQSSPLVAFFRCLRIRAGAFSVYLTSPWRGVGIYLDPRALHMRGGT